MLALLLSLEVASSWLSTILPMYPSRPLVMAINIATTNTPEDSGVKMEVCFHYVLIPRQSLISFWRELPVTISTLKCATYMLLVVTLWLPMVFHWLRFHYSVRTYTHIHSVNHNYLYVPGTASSKILTLLSVASDIYSKMNYDDVDCQKKIICEFMDQPEMFGKILKISFEYYKL